MSCESMHTLLFKPNLHIVSQSARLCSEAAGDVSSIYSTPKSSRAFAILTLVSVSKKAFANCSPSENKRKERCYHMQNCNFKLTAAVFHHNQDAFGLDRKFHNSPSPSPLGAIESPSI